MRTGGSQGPTLKLVGDGMARSGSAYDYSGNTNHASIISHRTKHHQLLEYLN